MAITKYFVDDHEEMVRLGILTKSDRVELIRGEIVPKMAVGPRRPNCLEVYRGPRSDGTYQESRVLRRGESTDIAALPGLVVAVDEVLL